jgi:hypothetical protein
LSASSTGGIPGHSSGTSVVVVLVVVLEVDVVEVDVVDVRVPVEVVDVGFDVVVDDPEVVEEGEPGGPSPELFSEVPSSEPVAGVVAPLRAESPPHATRPRNRRAAATRTAEVSRDRDARRPREDQSIRPGDESAPAGNPQLRKPPHLPVPVLDQALA